MPTTYKGTTIPLSSDLADGPAAFRDYTDSLPQAQALEQSTVPVGSVVLSILTVAPVNWLLLDGTTIIGAQTAYPKLWAVAPAAWRSGVDLILPNAKGRLPLGLDPSVPAMDNVGELGGATSLALVEANMPPHVHQQQGSFRSGGSTARHQHTPLQALGGAQYIVSGGSGAQVALGNGAHFEATTSDDATDHAHDTAISGPTSAIGAGTPVVVPLPPYIVVVFMVRAA